MNTRSSEAACRVRENVARTRVTGHTEHVIVCSLNGVRRSETSSDEARNGESRARRQGRSERGSDCEQLSRALGLFCDKCAE
jgi:hypothetical protein